MVRFSRFANGRRTTRGSTAFARSRVLRRRATSRPASPRRSWAMKGERLGAWLRRTRPGVELPDWARYLCIADPTEDPGHQADWKGQPMPDDSAMKEYVHFLLHLRPQGPPEEKPRKAADLALDRGWFVETMGARRPERCPLGLFARNVCPCRADHPGSGPCRRTRYTRHPGGARRGRGEGDPKAAQRLRGQSAQVRSRAPSASRNPIEACSGLSGRRRLRSGSVTSVRP